MNILELSAYFYPHKGGIEEVIKNLSTLWIKKKHHVTVVTSDQGCDKKYDVLDKIKIYYLKSQLFMSDPFFSTIFKTIKNLNKRQKFDIALIHHPHPFTLFAGAYSCKKNNIPYCVHMHGKELILTGYKRMFSLIYNKIFLKYILKNSKKIFICVNKIGLESDILKCYNNKIIIIPHGIGERDLDYSKYKSKLLLKKEFGLIGRKIIFSVGVLRNYKRLDILIRAMPKIIKLIPDVILIIGGRGPEEYRLKNFVEKLNLKSYVKFLGFISDDTKFRYYKASDLFILPSPTIMESFGLVALESSIVKTPVIVTSGIGISEVFTKHKIGMLVRPFDPDDLADKAIKLLKNPKLSRKIANKSYSVVKKYYLWDNIADQYLNILEQVKNDKTE